MRNFDEMKTMVLEVLETADGNYKAPANMDIDSLITDMLRFIGDTDSVLREGIYSTIWELIWAKEDVLSTEQLRRIIFTCIDDNHLFFGIGETDTNTVYA